MECQPEFWAYIKFCCFDVDVHGPFASKRKTVRMRSHLDITSASQSNTAEIIRFETINDFRRFDTIFGSFSRFGSTKGIPTGNITGIITQPHHVVATMGEGLNAAEPKFKRRDVRSYGIDFRYNIDRHIFYITIRYKLVRAKEDTTIKNYLAERRTLCGRRTTKRSRVAENIETPYHTTIKKGMEFMLDDVQYSIKKDYVSNDKTVVCVVEESENNNIIVGTEFTFNIERVHSLILDYINTF